MADFTEINKEYFDDMASTYNRRFAKTIKNLIGEIQDRLDWIGVDWVDDSDSDSEEEDAGGTSNSGLDSSSKKEVRVLDYACGTGLITRALAPYATHFVGIDISSNMITQYNLRATNQGIPSSEMHAIQGNLINPSDPTPTTLSSPEFHNFDLAVVGLGFHHFEDPGLAAKRLAERLKVGGVLFIVDFLEHGHHGHGDSAHRHNHDHGGSAHQHDRGKEKAHETKSNNTVMHKGFSKEQIEKMFSDAGVGGGFDYVEVGNGMVFEAGEGKGEARRVFMARGMKL